MECLLCIASIYFSGSLGVQNLGDPLNRTNEYGLMIGNAEVELELENGLFVKAMHTSGINTSEPDFGMNSIQVGGKIYLFKRSK